MEEFLTGPLDYTSKILGEQIKFDIKNFFRNPISEEPINADFQI